jgi:flagellar biosynthesis protein FlhA
VTGGNQVVGLVIFILLTVINFVVITKGSGRVAEVAARFTLDAMPGKQMSIDADLNAGIIDEDEARTRREKISSEADFYGSMDGASKFVRGDAIAGIIITVVNVVGGFVIGVAIKGMDWLQAIDT